MRRYESPSARALGSMHFARSTGAIFARGEPGSDSASVTPAASVVASPRTSSSYLLSSTLAREKWGTEGERNRRISQDYPKAEASEWSALPRSLETLYLQLAHCSPEALLNVPFSS